MKDQLDENLTLNN